jgi:hypothetical protein
MPCMPDFVSPIHSTDTATSAGHIDCRSEPVIYYSFYLWSVSSAWSTLARSVKFCECKTVALYARTGMTIRSILYIMGQNSFAISKYEILKSHKSCADFLLAHYSTTMGIWNEKRVIQYTLSEIRG